MLLNKNKCTCKEEGCSCGKQVANEGFENDLLRGVCYHEDIFDVPLLILLNIKANEKTIEAIEDWRYWNSK